jgi:hypothetical protein
MRALVGTRSAPESTLLQNALDIPPIGLPSFVAAQRGSTAHHPEIAAGIVCVSNVEHMTELVGEDGDDVLLLLPILSPVACHEVCEPLLYL